jgi:hypothetical protein
MAAFAPGEECLCARPVAIEDVRFGDVELENQVPVKR